MLVAERLGRRFGSRWLFRNLSFELGPGQVLAVTGSNGSGKSTLLRVIAGLMAPSEGRLERPGGIGYASLDLALYPSLTAQEHLAFSAELQECEARSHELLERVGLLGAGDLPAGRFSTGMRLRLKLALAIQTRPQLLLLDEPTASLDAAGRELVDGIVREQMLHGPVIVATNDPGDLRWATEEMRVGP